MIVTVPNSREISKGESQNNQSFTVYNIHVNGFHHCSLRYSELREFYSELGRLFPQLAARLPDFPSKTLFNSSSKIINERRLLLERFFHILCQNRSVVSSSYFNAFFLEAQIKSFPQFLQKNSENMTLGIRLLNNHEVLLENLSAKSNTNRLFEDCAKKFQIKEDLNVYFGLFLYQLENEHLTMIRPLCEFESPILSMEKAKEIYSNVLIVLKKSYWTPDYDFSLLDDRRTKNLLFIQAQHELQQANQFESVELFEQLKRLEESGSLKDYILRAQASRFYGKILIPKCSLLFPLEEESERTLRNLSLFMGNREFILCFDPIKGKKEEVIIKVTRIRSWKANPNEEPANIALEYLFRKDKLQWIKVNTKQSILISLSLQTMVKDILDRKAGATMPQMINSNPTDFEAVPKNNTNSTKIEPTNPQPQQQSMDRWNSNELFDRTVEDDDL